MKTKAWAWIQLWRYRRYNRKCQWILTIVSKPSNLFRDLPPAKQLTETNKRVANNILAKAEGWDYSQIQTAYLQNLPEKHCTKQLQTAAQSIENLINTPDNANYTQILQSLATLQPLDDFFEQVMVNSEDVTSKPIELALLKKVRGLF